MGKRLSQLNQINQTNQEDYLLVDSEGYLESKKIKLKDILLDNFNAENFYNKQQSEGVFIKKEKSKGLSSNDFTDEDKNKLDNSQEKLVTGQNIKSINGESILGQGNINIKSSDGNMKEVYTGKEEPQDINIQLWVDETEQDVGQKLGIIDQTYKPESENAQSGIAVAEAITNSTLVIKGVIRQLEYGATSGLYIVRADTVQAKLKNGDRFIIEVTGTKLSTDAYVYVDFNYATKITTFDLIYPQIDGLLAKRFKIVRGNWTSDSGIVEKDTLTEEDLPLVGVDIPISDITTTENQEVALLGDVLPLTLVSSTGWTDNGDGSYTHTSGTGELEFSVGEDTGTNLYQVSFMDSKKLSTSMDILVSIGNSPTFDLYGGESSVGIQSVANGNLKFVPSATYKGTISNIVVKRIIGSAEQNERLTVKDSDGNTSLEIHTTKADRNAIFIGNNSGKNNTNGFGNCSLGNNALEKNTSGFWNVGIGCDTLKSNTVGSRNIAVGYIALKNNITGTRNIAIGTFALNHNTTGNKNIAIGADSLDKNTAGSSNVAIGLQALYANTSGSSNVSVGSQSMTQNTVGAYNVALGAETLIANTTGSYNMAIGAKCLAKNTTASSNVGIGYTALYGCNNGANNVAIGFAAGKGKNGLFSNGVFIGTSAGQNLTDGANYNVFVGYNSGGAVTSGQNNVFLGNTAGKNITTGSYNICIGDNATTPTPTTSEWVSIGGLFEGSMRATDKYAKINGGLDLSMIPTTDPAIAGRVWNDNGTLKISAGA